MKGAFGLRDVDTWHREHHVLCFPSMIDFNGASCILEPPPSPGNLRQRITATTVTNQHHYGISQFPRKGLPYLLTIDGQQTNPTAHKIKSDNWGLNLVCGSYDRRNGSSGRYHSMSMTSHMHELKGKKHYKPSGQLYNEKTSTDLQR